MWGICFLLFPTTEQATLCSQCISQKVQQWLENWGLWWCWSQTICRSLFGWRRASGSISLRLVVPWWHGGWVTDTLFVPTWDLGFGRILWRTRITRWWQLKYFWNFHTEIWGRWTHFDSYVSIGLVQPPTSSINSITLLFMDKIQLVSDQKTCCWIKSGTNHINIRFFSSQSFLLECALKIQTSVQRFRWALSAEMLGVPTDKAGG